MNNDRKIDLLMAWANHAVVAAFGLVGTLYYDFENIVVRKSAVMDWIFATLIFMVIISFYLYIKAYQQNSRTK